jgi:hypothetical protein
MESQQDEGGEGDDAEGDVPIGHKPQDYQYDPDELANEWFPYRNREESEFHEILLLGTGIRDNIMNRIVHMVQRPGFIPDNLPRQVQQFRQRCKGLPTIKPEYVTVACKPKRVKKGGAVLAAGPQTHKTTCNVAYISILQLIANVMATPNFRSGLRWGIEDVGDGPVAEFNQTPFVKMAYKWSRLLSFFHRGREYLVGEFVSGPSQNHIRKPAWQLQLMVPEDSVFRIDSLEYKHTPHIPTDLREEKGNSYIPVLTFTGTVFRRIERGRELVQTALIVKINVEHIASHSPVVAVSSEEDIPPKGFFCRVSEDGNPYIPWVPEFTYPEVLDGSPFFWVNIFIDKYQSKDARATSSEAVYMMIENFESALNSTKNLVFVLSILPPGSKLDDLMALVRRDVRILEEGMQVFDCAVGMNITIKGAISGLAADHVQASINTRCGHTSAWRHSVSCWAGDDQACDYRADCLDHRMLRRRAQTDLIMKRLQRLECEKKSFKYVLASNITYFGITSTSVGPCLFSGLQVDPHLMTRWCFSHLVWYGIARTSLTCTFEAMSPGNREIYQIRLRDFPYPNGMKCPIDTIRASFGAGCTMTMWQSIAFASQHAMEGLAPSTNLLFNVLLVRWAASIMRPMTKDQLELAQKHARLLVKDGAKIFGDKFKRPNVHGLIELVLVTLPALRNGNFTKVDTFERVNKVSKEHSRGALSGRGGNGEIQAVLHAEMRRALWFMYHGMSWGSTGHTIGRANFERRDYREGRTHLPCPSLMSFLGSSRVKGMGVEKKVFGLGTWSIGTRRARGVAGLTDKQMSMLVEAFREFYELTTPKTDLTITHVRYVTSPANKKISEGDDVVMLDDRDEEFCTLDSILEVEFNSAVYYWVLPMWYGRVIPVDETFFRQTIRVSRRRLDANDCHLPEPLEQVMSQVCVVHRCTGREEGKSKCVLKKVNGLLVDYHDIVNNTEFEVFTRSCGLVESTEKKHTSDIVD